MDAGSRGGMPDSVDLASLALELAQSVGTGTVSEATADKLQSALQYVSFLRWAARHTLQPPQACLATAQEERSGTGVCSVDVEAEAEGPLLAGIGNLMVSRPKNLALLGSEETSHPNRYPEQ